MIPQLMGGLRSGMGLTGCASVGDLADQCPVRAHHRSRYAGEPRPRRDHHQGSSQLLGGALSPLDLGISSSDYRQPALGRVIRAQTADLSTFH